MIFLSGSIDAVNRVMANHRVNAWPMRLAPARRCLPVILAATAALHTAAQSANGDGWTCRHPARPDAVRRIWIAYPDGPPLPCAVMYQKTGEDSGEGVAQSVWTASRSSGYCERQAAAFVAKQHGWGWTCDAVDAAHSDAGRLGARDSGGIEPTAVPEDAASSTPVPAGVPATVQQHIDAFIYDVKFYLWKNADGAYPGDVTADPAVPADVNNDGATDFVLVYSVQNRRGNKRLVQYLQAFLKEKGDEFVPATGTLFEIGSTDTALVAVDKVENGVIELKAMEGPEDSPARRVALEDGRFQELEP
jgi:hypothetical protein